VAARAAVRMRAHGQASESPQALVLVLVLVLPLAQTQTQTPIAMRSPAHAVAWPGAVAPRGPVLAQVPVRTLTPLADRCPWTGVARAARPQAQRDAKTTAAVTVTVTAMAATAHQRVRRQVLPAAARPARPSTPGAAADRRRAQPAPRP
jgi:hypothetical protein